MRSGVVHLVALMVAMCTSAVVSAEDLYLGQKPPGVTAELFAPELAASDESLGCSGFLDDGKIFVLPMDDCIRIRTGERGSEAI